VKGAFDTEDTTHATDAARYGLHASTIVRGQVGTRKRLLVVPILILSDILLALVIWQVASLIQGVLSHHSLSQAMAVSMVPNLVAWVGFRAVLGLYPGYGLDQVEELRRHTFALLATVTIITVFAFALQVGDMLSRLLLFGWAMGLLLTAPLARSLVKWAMRRGGVWGKPVVVLGAQAAGARVLRVLQKEWQFGFRPVGIFDDPSVAVSKVALEGVPYGGTLTDAVAMAKDHKVDTAIFAMPHTRREDLIKLVDLAASTFRYVIVMPNLNGITTSAVIARDFAGSFGVEIKHTLLFPWARRVKRSLDLLLTVMGGLLISPLLLTIVVLIKLDSSGPAFYGQLRPGAGGKYFRCWKFRTMHINTERLLDEFLQGNPHLRAEWERTFKLRNDPRVTRVGRFLRKTSLDELPQLWNVLRGEMSLVGPRPMLLEEIPKYGEVYPLYKRVRPGITGPWQVSGRNDISHEERIEMVANYVSNWSVWLDVVILARTVRSVAVGRGAY
jgi:Undecaprenyl-phosphate galactose phosphotransferase WbaP